MACTSYLLSSNTPLEAALEPVELFDGIGQGGGDVSGRFGVQPLGPD